MRLEDIVKETDEILQGTESERLEDVLRAGADVLNQRPTDPETGLRIDPPLQNFDDSRGAGIWARLKASFPRAFEGTYRSFESSFGPENVRIHQASGMIQIRDEDTGNWYNATGSQDWWRNIPDYGGDAVELVPVIITSLISAAAWPVKLLQGLRTAKNIYNTLKIAGTTAAAAAGSAAERVRLDRTHNRGEVEGSVIPDESLSTTTEDLRYIRDQAGIAGATDLALGVGAGGIGGIGRLGKDVVRRITGSTQPLNRAASRQEALMRIARLKEEDGIIRATDSDSIPLTPGQLGDRAAANREGRILSRHTPGSEQFNELYDIQLDIAEDVMSRRAGVGRVPEAEDIARRADDIIPQRQAEQSRNWTDLSQPQYRRPTVMPDHLDIATTWGDQFKAPLGRFLESKGVIAVNRKSEFYKGLYDEAGYELSDLLARRGSLSTEEMLTLQRYEDILKSTGDPSKALTRFVDDLALARPDQELVTQVQRSWKGDGGVYDKLFEIYSRPSPRSWNEFSAVKETFRNLESQIDAMGQSGDISRGVAKRITREIQSEVYPNINNARDSLLRDEFRTLARQQDLDYARWKEVENIIVKALPREGKQVNSKELARIFQKGAIDGKLPADVLRDLDPQLFNEIRARILVDSFIDPATGNFSTQQQLRRKLRSTVGESSMKRYFDPNDELTRSILDLTVLKEAIKAPRNFASSPGPGIGRPVKLDGPIRTLWDKTFGELGRYSQAIKDSEHFDAFARQMREVINSPNLGLDDASRRAMIEDIDAIVAPGNVRAGKVAADATLRGGPRALAHDQVQGLNRQEDYLDQVGTPIEFGIPLDNEEEIREPTLQESSRIRDINHPRRIGRGMTPEVELNRFGDPEEVYYDNIPRPSIPLVPTINYGLDFLTGDAEAAEHPSEVTALPEIEEDLPMQFSPQPLPQLEEKVTPLTIEGSRDEFEYNPEYEAMLAEDEGTQPIEPTTDKRQLNLQPITTTATPEEVERRQREIERRKRNEDLNKEYERIMSQVRGF